MVTITSLYRPGGVSKCRNIPYGREGERYKIIAVESIHIDQGVCNRSSSIAARYTYIEFVQYLASIYLMMKDIFLSIYNPM